MTSRTRSGNRQANMKARIGIATAVLVGGGAIGVAVAASGHGGASASNAAYRETDFDHNVSMSSALNTAFNTRSQSTLFNELARMEAIRNLAVQRFGRTEFAAQRGVVELATKDFLVVKSANGHQFIWWLSGATKTENVADNPAGLVALTGSNVAAEEYLLTHTTTAAATAMVGSSTAATSLATTAATTARTITITVNTGVSAVTITVTVNDTATVTAPVTATTTTKTTTTIPATTTAAGIAAGDLVLVTGTEQHNYLSAKTVLFAPQTTSTTPTTTTTPTATPTATSTSGTSSTVVNGEPAETGTHS